MVPAGFLVFVLLSPLPARQLKVEHQKVLDALNRKGVDGKVRDFADPRIPGLLRQGWALAGQWASQYLDTYPDPRSQELTHIFDDFAPPPKDGDYGFTGSALRVGRSVYVVQASYAVDFPTSTFMVVARNQTGHFEALWDIKTLAETHLAQRDEIGRWVYLSARAYYSGPLVIGKLLPLGRSRFLVDAYQAADGGTHLGQLSIWEWDGHRARPLLVDRYQFGADDYKFRFDGHTIRISTKEELSTLFSCGMCPEPKGTWTVRVTPGRVENLGHRFEAPELKWADQMLSAVSNGDRTTPLAAPAVIDKIRAYEAKTAEFSWGMLMRYSVLRRGPRRTLVVETDNARLRLRYVRRNDRPYFTGVEIQ